MGWVGLGWVRMALLRLGQVKLGLFRFDMSSYQYGIKTILPEVIPQRRQCKESRQRESLRRWRSRPLGPPPR